MGNNERMRRLYANHLGRDERVLSSVRGTVDVGRAEAWTGLLLATDRRLVFIAGNEATYLPYSAIDRVERGKGMIGGYVSLTTRGHNVRIKWIESRRVRPFVRAVHAGVRAGRAKRRWWPSARPAENRR